MLKKTITYTDFDDQIRTEDFYFNLTQAEITDMELSYEGGLKKMLEKIVSEKDTKRIGAIFEEIILKAYGEKSLDGKKFVKNDAVKESFYCTQAYSDLYMEIIMNPDAASAFINGIIPQTKDKTPNIGLNKPQ